MNEPITHAELEMQNRALYASQRVSEYKARLSEAVVREVDDFTPHDFQNETPEFLYMRSRYGRLLAILAEHGISIHAR